MRGSSLLDNERCRIQIETSLLLKWDALQTSGATRAQQVRTTIDDAITDEPFPETLKRLHVPQRSLIKVP